MAGCYVLGEVVMLEARYAAWAETFGRQAGLAIQYAVAIHDKRIAHVYHEIKAVALAKKAAHNAFRYRPDLKRED
jgi:hypothetical protein